MTDFFATVTASDGVGKTGKAAWPFPSERKRKERDLLTAVLGQDKPENQCCHDYANCADPCVVPDEPAPAHIARARAFAPAANLTVLALDLGTTTGFAIAPRGKAVRSGSFRLDPNKLGGNGRRWMAFREWLTDTAREVGGIGAVYHEDVKNHAGVIAAHVYGGYLAMLEAWCAANNIPLHGVGVGTAKKHWTGNGRASKDQMIAEAERRGIRVTDDNEADALAVLAYGVAQES